MSDDKKYEWEFLKIKLDFIKPFLTTLIIINAGLISYGFLNFNKNNVFVNIVIYFGVLSITVIFLYLLTSSVKILKQMKGMLK